MRFVPQAVLVLGAALAAACGGGEVGIVAPTAPVPRPTPAPVARYRVTFEATWSAGSHPADFPAAAHFSPLVGGTHGARARFWGEDVLATEGIEAMAERGNPRLLAAEIEAAIARGEAEHVMVGEGLSHSPGQISLEFEVGRDRSLVTLVTMVAPSPDWFTGVHDLDLLEEGDWVRTRVVTLFAYDAGTDSGRTYESEDRDTAPREPIHRILGHPLAVSGSVAPLGTYTFERLVP